MGVIERFVAWAARFGIEPHAFTRIIVSALIVVGYMMIGRVVSRVLAGTVTDGSSRYQIKKGADYLLGAIALAFLARVWIQGVTGLATYFGLLSAGIALALQDPIINLAGWLFIVTRRPFEVGDRIQISGHAGDVVDVRIFQFTMLEIGNWVGSDQSTGRVIHVPNGWVFKHSIASYDGGFRYIWNEIAVVVTFESDWRRAKEVLVRTINEHAEHLSADATREIDEAAERYHIRFSKLTPVVWTSVVDQGVQLTMRYLCKPRNRRSSQHEIWEAVLDAFQRLPDVDFAYPTERRFDSRMEGKPEMRGDHEPVRPDAGSTGDIPQISFPAPKAAAPTPDTTAGRKAASSIATRDPDGTAS